MPALWKHMPVENCNKVVSIIDSFGAGDAVIWSEENVKKLLPFVPLKDMCKLHTCYIVAKKDGSVFVGGHCAKIQSNVEMTDDEEKEEEEHKAAFEASAIVTHSTKTSDSPFNALSVLQGKIPNHYHLKPPQLIQDYKNKAEEDKMKLFNHMCSFDENVIEPSGHLNIEMSDD